MTSLPPTALRLIRPAEDGDDMQTTAPNHHCRRAPLAVAAVSCVVAIAACGGSSAKPTASSGGSELALSRCMRAHGVPNFPDPRKGPGGSEGMSVSQAVGSSTLTVDGISFSGPAFQSAERTCKLFGGGSSPPPISESQKVAAFRFAQCMRKHGVPNYPDPTFPSGGGIETNLGPGFNLRSPASQNAAKACGNY
jgi:hypothetical protein